MDIHIDYQKRVERVREGLAKRGIDLFLATRGKSVNWIGGAFIPWRSVVPVSRDGFIQLNTLLMDAERLKTDSWLGDKVVGTAPLPGMELWDVTVQQIKDLGLDKSVIGVELGHSPRMIAGYLFATEYEFSEGKTSRGQIR